MDRGKYADLLDPELWDYIERVNEWYPPAIIESPIEDQRVVYDAMCRAFHQPRPPGVIAQDEVVTSAGRSVPVRRYHRQGAVPTAQVIYYHGGGFVLGGLESHDDICAEMCDLTGLEIVSVDYRLAPEHRHPAAFDDAVAAFEGLTATADLPVVLCGESAGGNLAAAVAHATRDHPRAAIGQMLIYPELGGDVGMKSYREYADAPLLTLKDIVFYRKVRIGDESNSVDATLEPLRDSDFSRLPPSFVLTAQCDPLSSDGGAYCGRIAAAGGKACWREEPRLVHGFLRARSAAPRARAGFDTIAAALSALARRDWPY